MFNWFRKQIATTTLFTTICRFNLSNSIQLFLLMISKYFFLPDCVFGKYILLCNIYIYIYLFLDSFKTTAVADNNNANYKQCTSMQRKSNKSDSLMHVIIGLTIVALLIVFIYLIPINLNIIKYAVVRFSFQNVLLIRVLFMFFGFFL